MEEVELASHALIIFYAEMRPRSSKDPAADPRSALAKLRGVWRYAKVVHKIDMVSLSQVQLACKGLCREYIEAHGVASLVPERKLPLTNRLIDGMLACPDGARRGGLCVDWSTYRWKALRAVFATLAESGERKDEIAKASAQTKFRKGRFTFDSLRFKVGGVSLINPSAAELAGMAPGDGVYLAHGVAKNDPMGTWFAATPSFLPWRPLAAGRCACRELVALHLAAQVPAERRATTPLFGPEVGEEFTHAEVDAAFLLLLVVGNGMSEDAARAYSVHSFRIFCACALLKSNCPRWLIKRLLRWRGDDSIEIYARLNDDEWVEWLAKAAEAQVDSTIVPRLPTIDASLAEYERYQQTALALLSLDPAQGARSRSAEL